jgi:hypothetical protein
MESGGPEEVGNDEERKRIGISVSLAFDQISVLAYIRN